MTVDTRLRKEIGDLFPGLDKERVDAVAQPPVQGAAEPSA